MMTLSQLIGSSAGPDDHAPTTIDFDWTEQVRARLEARAARAGKPAQERGPAQTIGFLDQPDNPVAAQRLGWAYVGGVVPAPRERPRHGLEALLGDETMRERIVGDPALARALGLEGLVRSAAHVEVVRRSEYAFDARADAEERIPLGHVDSTDFAAGVLIVRLHEAPSWTSSSASASVRIFNASRPETEPGTAFVEDTAIATVTIANGTTAPALFTASLSAPIAARLRVELRWSQGSQTSSSQERLTIGVEIVGRRD